jgi:glutamine amidotransferase
VTAARSPVVGVVDYDMGNLRSVAKALEWAGATPRLVSDADGVAGVPALIVPGVGAFGACMRNLAARGLDRAIVDHAAAGRPLFGVCLGMQVLFEWSEEGAVDGLGILPGKVRKLPATVKVPHMGWNDVSWTGRHPFVADAPSGTRFYFVHSYACEASPEVTIGEVEHGSRFAAVVARDNVFGTQFHPEKSGPPGPS